MTSSNPTPLTLEEHRELGAELRRTRSRIHELAQLVNSVYGPNNQAAFSFEKASEALNRLCLDLQAQADRDCPGQATDKLYSGL